MEENKLTTRMVRDWNQISQRGCEISIPADTHKLPRHGTEHPALTDPSLSRGGTRGHFQTQLLLWFCNLIH